MVLLINGNYIPTISETRKRLSGEIIPASVEHSGTKNGNEEYHAAAFAIDLDWAAKSTTVAGSDGKAWLKVNLANTHCIKQVVWYNNDGSPRFTWNCTSTDCSNCKGTECSYYLLTVSTEESTSKGVQIGRKETAILNNLTVRTETQLN